MLSGDGEGSLGKESDESIGGEVGLDWGADWKEGEDTADSIGGEDMVGIEVKVKVDGMAEDGMREWG